MNDNYKNSKIKKFLEDEGMSNAVFEEVNNSFVKASEHNKDVQFLAANMLCIVLFKKAWNELQVYKSQKIDDKPSLRQIGL